MFDAVKYISIPHFHISDFVTMNKGTWFWSWWRRPVIRAHGTIATKFSIVCSRSGCPVHAASGLCPATAAVRAPRRPTLQPILGPPHDIQVRNLHLSNLFYWKHCLVIYTDRDYARAPYRFLVEMKFSVTCNALHKRSRFCFDLWCLFRLQTRLAGLT